MHNSSHTLTVSIELLSLFFFVSDISFIVRWARTVHSPELSCCLNDRFRCHLFNWQAEGDDDALCTHQSNELLTVDISGGNFSFPLSFVFRFRCLSVSALIWVPLPLSSSVCLWFWVSLFILHQLQWSESSEWSEKLLSVHSFTAIPTCMLMIYRAIITMQHNKGQVRRCQRLFVSFTLSLSCCYLLHKLVKDKAAAFYTQIYIHYWFVLLPLPLPLSLFSGQCVFVECESRLSCRSTKCKVTHTLHRESQIFTVDDSINCTQKSSDCSSRVIFSFSLSRALVIQLQSLSVRVCALTVYPSVFRFLLFHFFSPTIVFTLISSLQAHFLANWPIDWLSLLSLLLYTWIYLNMFSRALPADGE